MNSHGKTVMAAKADMNKAEMPAEKVPGNAYPSAHVGTDLLTGTEHDTGRCEAFRREALSRTEMLLGREAMERLWESRILLFGVGGVGGYALEALLRAGVGTIDIVDGDTVDISNLNRQILASVPAIGKSKVEVARARAAAIAPQAKLHTHSLFYLPENRGDINPAAFDFVIDAIDTVKAKVDIIYRCEESGTPVISAMGCGNRLDPSLLKITDIYRTKNDPLARIMRKELRARGIKKLTVAASDEIPLHPHRGAEDFSARTYDTAPTSAETLPDSAPLTQDAQDAPTFSQEKNGRNNPPGSTAFVPSVAGLLIASYVIRKLCGLL